MKEDGRFEMLTKKERLELDREHESLMKNLAGIKEMNGLPDMLFVIDVRKEDIAVAEANRLNIPVVAVVDTNCSPEGITQVIPGNDDALRAIRLFASRIADSILEGRQIATEGGIAVSDAQATDAGEGQPSGATEPSIQVADQSFATADATVQADETATIGSYVEDETGAFGAGAVKSEIEKSGGYSEKIANATAKNAPKNEASQTESNEAAAS